MYAGPEFIRKYDSPVVIVFSDYFSYLLFLIVTAIYSDIFYIYSLPEVLASFAK